MQRTIIDILRKGNQELFHSAIIAWLLDPKGEHGFGAGFLNAFAETVEDKGYPKFRTALQASPTVKITTETTGPQSRYDIRLEIQSTFVVIENKTKSLGDDPQLEKYQGENTILVALGLCDLSFSEQVKGKYPLVTYDEVVTILGRLPELPGSAFKVLVDQYRQFLNRELEILWNIDRWYATSDSAHAAKILELVEGIGAYTKNDRRFFNLYLLERLRRDLVKSPRWKHCRLEIYKNTQSGVSLALFDAEKEASIYCYKNGLAAVCKEQDATIWFHLELWDGVLATDGESSAGVIQLRCKTKNAKIFVEGFRRMRPLEKGESYSARMKKDARSHYLLARPLHKKHLTANEFRKQLEDFAATLGRFG